MGQKVNPHGFRVGVIKNWDSRWFVGDGDFGDTLVSDHKVREYIKKNYREAGIPKIEIERVPGLVRVFVHCSKPGMIVGHAGAEINKLKGILEKMLGSTVSITVVEVRNPDVNAQLVAESIAKQLEGRASFRRAMKMAIGRTMKLGAKGIKITCGGRLGGAEIARTEHYHEGSIPLQTLRADIDYGFAEANTTYGKIGVKVWVYKGEVLRDSGKKRHFAEAKIEAPKPDRRRGDRRFDRRDNDKRGNNDRYGGYKGSRQGAGDRQNGAPQGGEGNRGPRPQGEGSRGPRPQGYGNRPQNGGFRPQNGERRAPAQKPAPAAKEGGEN
ncbi:MAG: 30S ribosomal protein S3 [Clostridia bacterium]|nr:30S ribosomal protein S3 [Clostridia bacterium]